MSSKVVIVSGGMDSTVLLMRERSLGHLVYALSVDYGQRHRREIDYASKTCLDNKIPHKVARLGSLRDLLGRSSQTSTDISVPHGHYAANNMKLTIVPNRNMIMLSIAVGWALSIEAKSVVYGAHAGDHTIYPDCRQEFIEALEKAVAICDWRHVQLERPFIHMSKADIVTEGTNLCIDFRDTWSCYEGGAVHCGACGTCVERREAFVMAGVEDLPE